MWVATTIGFFSAVQHRDDPDQLMIRARSRADLVNLVTAASRVAVPAPEIVETLDNADYPYRLTISKAEWVACLSLLTDELDYDNFKNAVARTNVERAHTYHDVWSALHRIEREPDARAKPGPGKRALRLAALAEQAKAAPVIPMARNKRGTRR